MCLQKGFRISISRMHGELNELLILSAVPFCLSTTISYDIFEKEFFFNYSFDLKLSQMVQKWQLRKRNFYTEFKEFVPSVSNNCIMAKRNAQQSFESNLSRKFFDCVSFDENKGIKRRKIRIKMKSWLDDTYIDKEKMIACVQFFKI